MVLESRAPQSLAEEWDNVGLLVGDPGWSCKRVLAGVDLSPSLVERASREGAGLIICHHPPIFRPIHRLVAHRAGDLSTLLLRCAESRIGVAACHTNFDRASLEVISRVSQGLGVEPSGRFQSGQEFEKLTTFVPGSHLEGVRDQVFAAGAGRIGGYDQCSFEVLGTGGFRPGAKTKPFLGKPGSRETLEEIRVEALVPAGLKPQVLRALLESHPYEEVAYEWSKVDIRTPRAGVVSGVGYGFWGEFFEPVPLEEGLSRIQRVFGTPVLKVHGTPRPIRRIGFCAGKANAFIQESIQLDVDAFLVGEVDYHSALARDRAGGMTFELGHPESEVFFPEIVQGWF